MIELTYLFTGRFKLSKNESKSESLAEIAELLPIALAVAVVLPEGA